jgi:hypothetical protein
MRFSGPSTSRLLRRISWRIRPDRNRLRRGADRIERGVLVGLIILFVLAAPVLGVFAGRWAQAGAHRVGRSPGSHEVVAHLLRSAPPPLGPVDPSRAVASVQARWTAPDGAQRTGAIEVPGGSRLGSPITIWTDSAGRPVAGPLQGGQIVAQAVFAVAGAVAALAALLTVVAVAVRRVLDARRLRGWEAGWTMVGPHWTERR